MRMFMELPDTLMVYILEDEPDPGCYVLDHRGDKLKIKEFTFKKWLAPRSLDEFYGEEWFKSDVRIEFEDGYVYVGVHWMKMTYFMKEKA